MRNCVRVCAFRRRFETECVRDAIKIHAGIEWTTGNVLSVRYIFDLFHVQMRSLSLMLS